jgi:hypothetical protein
LIAACLCPQIEVDLGRHAVAIGGGLSPVKEKKPETVDEIRTITVSGR